MHLNVEFGDRQELIQTLARLRQHGVAPASVDVFSDTPLEIPKSVLDRRSHMSLAVVTGAVTALLLACGFVYFTQHNYPLITGGMPIFSFWATGVVFFELTMLGAVITSFLWFLRESGLLRRSSLPVPAFEPGTICLRVQFEPAHEEGIKALLQGKDK
jgi:hypothetical protein